MFFRIGALISTNSLNFDMCYKLQQPWKGTKYGKHYADAFEILKSVDGDSRSFDLHNICWFRILATFLYKPHYMGWVLNRLPRPPVASSIKYVLLPLGAPLCFSEVPMTFKGVPRQQNSRNLEQGNRTLEFWSTGRATHLRFVCCTLDMVGGIDLLEM